MATINGRIALKHDTEEHWKKATNFIPFAGEAIIYDVDTNHSYPRIKIGNGSSNPEELPFVSNQDDINTIVSSSLSGLNSSDPTASGTSTTFIKTIAQENGLIKATKATVATASTTAAGLMSAADKAKLDGIAAGATANTGDITGVTAGNGLTGGGTSGSVTLNVGAGAGLTVAADSIGHTNSVTAGTASEGGSARTLGFGGTFNVPSITYDAQGHVTGKGSTTLTMPSDRLFTTLVPTGTSIPANANLNTTDYLKVGRYYCSKNDDAKTLKNCPTVSAFMMEVYSPLSTTIDNETNKTWVYRLRKITVHNSGIQFIQYCSVGATAGSWTYNPWRIVPLGNFTLDSTDTNGGTPSGGNATNPIYIDSSGYFQPCTYSLNATVPANAKFTDTTYEEASTSAAGLMSIADKTKLNKISLASMAIYGPKITVTKTDGTSTEAFVNGIATAASGTAAEAGRLQYTISEEDTLTKGSLVAKRNISGSQSTLWVIDNTDHAGGFRITWYKKEGGWAGQANLIHSKNYSTQIPAATTTAAGLMSSSDKTTLNQLLTEVIPITRGGTGATTAIAARENLLIKVSASQPTSPTAGTIWFDIS